MTKPFRYDAPRFPEDLEAMNFDTLQQDDYYENCLFQDCTFTDDSLEKIYFKHVKFINCTFENVHFYNIEFVDVIFDKCNISNSELIGTIIHRTAFKNTKLVGTNFAEASLIDVTFNDSLANYTSFNYATIKRVVFTETALMNAEFQEMKWTKLLFDACNLNGGNFLRTNLKGLDLSRSMFEHIAFSLEDISGLTISPAQSLVIAGGLGIQIAD